MNWQPLLPDAQTNFRLCFLIPTCSPQPLLVSAPEHVLNLPFPTPTHRCYSGQALSPQIGLNWPPSLSSCCPVSKCTHTITAL